LKPLRIAVIGIGSAGIQTLAHFLPFLPVDSEMVAIYDPAIKNLGIGESTNPSFTTAIERGLNFDILNDLDKLDGTYKLGTTYINWRDH
jgi:predicted dehydrogenase